MSSSNRKSREQLKEEYKQHFRKMRTAKEQYRRARKSKNIANALKDMNSSELMESFDSFLFELQSNVTRAEARLDVALESMNENPASATKTDVEEADKKAKAKETLQQVKADMGMLYSELEEQASQIEVDKTVGSNSGNSQPKKDKT